MGLDFEFKSLANTMKTKKQAMKKSIGKKCVNKKRSVGRPRKSNIKAEIFSDASLENSPIRTSVIKKMPDENFHAYQNKKLIKSNHTISEIKVYIFKILIIIVFKYKLYMIK